MHWKIVDDRPLRKSQRTPKYDREFRRVVSRICDTLIWRLRANGSENNRVRKFRRSTPQQYLCHVDVELGEHAGLDGLEHAEGDVGCGARRRNRCKQRQSLRGFAEARHSKKREEKDRFAGTAYHGVNSGYMTGVWWPWSWCSSEEPMQVKLKERFRRGSTSGGEGVEEIKSDVPGVQLAPRQTGRYGTFDIELDSVFSGKNCERRWDVHISPVAASVWYTDDCGSSTFLSFSSSFLFSPARDGTANAASFR
ncbi:hypothetical protein C8R44DRAFT_738657 [Mycena epipterygia]|nr:hypothetical protein C8R44DRAFT_738657 [Mycena epipterygia]